MKLVFPVINQVDPVDRRFMGLAEFLGAPYATVPVDTNGYFSTAALAAVTQSRECCLVLNVAASARAMNPALRRFHTFVLSRFRFVLLYNVDDSQGSANFLYAMTGGVLAGLRRATGPAYSASELTPEVLGPFSGLDVPRSSNIPDYVMAPGVTSSSFHDIVSISNCPMLASIRAAASQILVLARHGIEDVASEDNRPLNESFSGLLLPALLLRYMFGKAVWHPRAIHATLIIDDPFLRNPYGFLDYRRLLELMDRHQFHTSIGFIPFNHGRSSRNITRLFRERADRYSLCYHGNDHTRLEFATEDIGLLNSMISTATDRMSRHESRHRIPCGRVMVFPQGAFSRPALGALQRHNFYAAINSGCVPFGEVSHLRASNVLEPATLAFNGFPLFNRHYVRQTTPLDIATSILTGKPLFFVEHHKIFQDEDALIALVSLVNRLASDVRWSSVEYAVRHAYQCRDDYDGHSEIRPYSTRVDIFNETHSPRRYVLPCQRGDVPSDSRACAQGFELPPGASITIASNFSNDLPWNTVNTGLQWRATAFVRRTLSDLRDIHLCHHPRLHSFAQSLRARLGSL